MIWAVRTVEYEGQQRGVIYIQMPNGEWQALETNYATETQARGEAMGLFKLSSDDEVNGDLISL